jgi:hypothetical protein
MLGAVCSLSMLMIAAGCGGDATFGPTPVVPAPDTTLVGVVSNAPVSGARVCAYQLANGKRGTLLGSCVQTDVAGNYVIGFRDYAGEAIAEASGGTYRDMVTGATRTLTLFRSIRPGNVLPLNANTVHITPLTELAVQRAESLGGLTTTLVTEGARDVVSRFGGFDLHRSFPADLTTTQALTMDVDKRAYGLALAGLSGYLVNKASVGTVDTLLKDFNAKITASTLSAETQSFREGISTFLRSARNGSGLTTTAGNGLIALNFGAGPITTQPPTITEGGEKCLLSSPKWSALGVKSVCWFNLPVAACSAFVLQTASVRILSDNGLADTPDGYLSVTSCRNQNQLYTADWATGKVYVTDPF